MRLRHPLSSMSRGDRWLLMQSSGAATAVVGAAIWWLVRPLQTAAAPLGIFSFELAGKAFIVRSILASWGNGGAVRAAFAVGLGALFAILCWVFFSELCLLAAERIRARGRALSGAGTVLAWAQFAALAAAVVEEVLLLMLLTDPVSRMAAPARYCAEAKYAILLGGGFYCVLCFYYTELLARVATIVFKDVPMPKAAAKT